MAVTKCLLIIMFVGFLSCTVFGENGASTDASSSGNQSRETAISDLPQLVGNEDGIELLYEEFASIEGGPRRPWTIASLPENIKKNRYNDLLAFDHSRVVLDKLPDDNSSDYINANYIDGQSSEKEYVATQGPLPDTVNDFWRMIWQLNATKIVMLANVIEHGEVKVEQYWPNTSYNYGNIVVTNIMEHPIPRLHHVVRTFSVNKSGIVESRIVRQFHFTGWPDLGVPKERLPVISIIRQARLYDPESKAPIVVHCSAGIGRTGTIILMDSMIERGKAETVVDFPKRLDHMRTLRPDLVERKEQYVFAHQAVNDVFNSPEMQQQLEEVEELYKDIDNPMDSEDLVPSRDINQTLHRMRRHNSIMRTLINNMMELQSS